MTTIAREYMDAKTELNRKYGIHPFMVPTPADWRTELDELMHSFYKKSIRHESNYDIAIDWYPDGSATWIGEHSKGVEIWMDEGMDGYEAAREHFSALEPSKSYWGAHVHYAFPHNAETCICERMELV